MSEDFIENLIRKVKAIIACGAGSQRELARFIFKVNKATPSHKIQVCRWLSGTHRPNGNTAGLIQSWAASKTLEIDAAGTKTKAAYRKAFGK